MASIYHGRGAAIGFALEDTYGTAKSPRTNWRPLISSSLTRTIEKVPRPTLRVGSAGAMRRRHYVQSDGVSGSFSVEGQYTSIGLLIKNLLGASSTTGSGPYTHVYTIADDVPLGLTIENNRGTGTSEILEGCRLNSGTIAVSAGGVMTCEFDVIGETGQSTPRGTAGTPNFSTTDAPILHSHAGSLSWDSKTYDLIDMSLTVNNALAVRQHLGSTVTKKPLRSDFQSIELSVTIEVDDELYAEYISDLEDDCSITFTSGSNSFAIELQNAYISSASDPISDANVVRQSLTFVGQSDGTDEGLKITVVNGNSSATSND